MTYDLWYWDGIPGRGEFVRLALEAGGIAYRERAREPGVGEDALIQDMLSDRKQPPFAPPSFAEVSLAMVRHTPSSSNQVGN